MKNIVLLVSASLLSLAVLAQKPEISYDNTVVLTVGKTMNPLAPVHSGGLVSANRHYVATFAGAAVSGNADGLGILARFNNPTGLAFDENGNLFVADKNNHLIRKVAPSGQVTTFAGSGNPGSANGKGTLASFNGPSALVFDAAGNLYVSDQYNHLIRKITPDGTVSTYAGNGIYGNYDSVNPGSALFNNPDGLAMDSVGNMYVADSWNKSIRKIAVNGVVTTLAANSIPNSIPAPNLNNPCAVVSNAAGYLFVADQKNHLIRRITPAGVVTTYAGTGTAGSADGPKATATFNNPSGLLLDKAGNLLVADKDNFKIRKITPEGVVSTLVGQDSAGTTDGLFADVRFAAPWAMASDAQGNLYIADRTNHEIRQAMLVRYTIAPKLPNGLTFDNQTGVVTGTPSDLLSGQEFKVVVNNEFGLDTTKFFLMVQASTEPTGRPKINYTLPASFVSGVAIDPISPVNTGGAVVASDPVVSTIAGGTTNGLVNGTGSAARFYYPSGVATDKSGAIFVTDKYNHVIRKITPEGVVSTFAGTGAIGSADGQGTAASFYYPGAVVIDANENLYVSDQLNMKIRKITKSGLVSTYAGDGIEDSDDGPASTASFRRPESLALDTAGNLYVAEFWGHKIRKITPSGVVSTLAGSGLEGSVDGQGTAASFNWPCGLCIDSKGVLFVADQYGHQIRKVTRSGAVTTLAGTGKLGFANGKADSAQFNYPSGLLADASGNLYVADRSNNRIRKISPEGVVSTYAGSGATGAADGASQSAGFNFPFAMTFDPSGNIIVADRYNHEIRKISSSTYRIRPALPKGLMLDPTTGVIHGTPLVGMQTTRFLVDTQNAFGSDSSELSITVLGVPEVLTESVSSVTSYSAKAFGNMTNLGNPVTKSIGFCWNTTGNPTVNDDKVQRDSVANLGLYSLELKNLMPTTFYYVRAFATNTYGTSYGPQLTFTTQGLKPEIRYPQLDTLTVGQTLMPVTPINTGGVVQNGIVTVTTLSGIATSGFVNGPVLNARYNCPTSVAVDKSGNIFVADKYNHVIRKITPDGLVSTFAGSGSIGSADGQGSAASFYYPAEVAVGSDGQVFVTDQYNNKIRKISKTGMVTTLAGGSQGSYDGTGSAASFYYPEGIVVDTLGTVYVTDLYNHKIRKITASGVVTTLAGGGSTGATDGSGSAARFNYPSGLCIDADGSLLVADQYNGKIRRVTPSGVVTTFAGSGAATSVDGPATSATFNYPSGIVRDATGNFYVVERSGNRVRKISTDRIVTTLAGGSTTGLIDGSGTNARFLNPFGIALDADENLLIADRNNHAIRKITMSGFTINRNLPYGMTFNDKTGAIGGTPELSSPMTTYTITARNEVGSDTATVQLMVWGKAGLGTVEVSGTKTTRAECKVWVFSRGVPAATSYGFCWNTTGNPTIADRVWRKDTVLTGTTYQYVLDSLKASTTYYIRAFATSSLGTAYGNENSFTTIDLKPAFSYATPKTFQEQIAIEPLQPTNTGGPIRTSGTIVTTLAGNGSATLLNGTGNRASFNNPAAVAVGKNGTIYVADKYNHVIRKITESGEVTTLAGSGTAGYANGTGTAASFYYPSALVVDANDNVYVSDQYNYRIRKITKEGTVTTVAGTGYAGSADGNGTSASFYYPEGIVVDTLGNLFVADYYNNKIRKITPAGTVSTLAGSGSYGSMDGTGTTASFNYPCGLSIDALGTLYVADQSNNKIRKVTQLGVVTTLAGTGNGTSLDGSALEATFNAPSGLANDAYGNLYISERYGNRIRKWSPDGRVSTVAGGDTAGSTDGMKPYAKFNVPFGIAFDPNGNLIVADRFNHLIRKVSMMGFSVQPALPDGLTIDALTGVVRGTPLHGNPSTVYTVTAGNSGGTGVAKMYLTVEGKGIVTTLDINGVTNQGAQLNARLTNLGYPSALSYGFCMNTKGMPTMKDSVLTKGYPLSNGDYSLKINNLTPGTTYFVRAFVTNTLGTSYGEAKRFTTTMDAPEFYYNFINGFVVGKPIVPFSPIQNGGRPLSYYQVSTYAGDGSYGYMNGSADSSSFYYPTSVDVDSEGNLYVADYMKSLIRKISDKGIVSTLAGTSSLGASDGPGNLATFYRPRGLAVDAKGNVYVADSYNNKIRKITKEGIVSTFAGSTTSGNANGTGADARFYYPTSVAVDANGMVYVADSYNNRLCKITPEGVVTTLAAALVDGVGGVHAPFGQIYGVAVDSMGSVYVSDNGGNRIFKYLPTDTIIVLAGSGNSSTVDGTGLSASFYHPMGIAVDALGSVYVAEYGNHCIRKIDSNAVVTTLAGTVSNSGFQDGKANAALFKNPSDIACDKNGKLYVTDYMNNRIRCIQPVKYAINPALPKGLQFDNQTGTISGTPSQTQDTTLYTVTAENTAGTCNTMLLITVASSLSGLTHQTGNDCAFYPNPVQNQIGIRGVTGTERLSIHSLTGVLLMTKEVSAGSTVDVSDLDPGVYLLRLAGREYKLVKK